MSLAYNELKKGMALDVDGKPCILLEYSRSKKDRGAPVIRLRYKEIRTEKVLVKSYSGYDIKIEAANIQRVSAIYLYSDRNNYVFMNNSSYEQINLSKEILGNRINYLVDQLQIDLLYFENNPISIELPNFVDMKVILTSNIQKLGKIGDLVSVKDGYARNCLFPQKKALRENRKNLEYFEKIKEEFKNKEKIKKDEAENLLNKLNDISIMFSKEADEKNQLYGAISKKEILNFLTEKEIKFKSDDIQISEPIRSVGEHFISINPYQDISKKIKVIVKKT